MTDTDTDTDTDTESISGAPTPRLKKMGYKSLTPDQMSLMEEIKAEGANLKLLLWKLEGRTIDGSVDPHWLAEGKTDLQKGLMSLTRSIAQPEFF